MGGLAEACLALTPKVSLPKPGALYLDIAGTQRLFGGEAGTLFRAEKILAGYPSLHARVLVDRPEWAAAMVDPPGDLFLPPGRSREQLWRRPVERLALCGDPAEIEDEIKEREKLTTFMRRVGMRAIGDFARLSPPAIVRRFGRFGLRLQEWVTEKREWLLPPFLPPEKIQESIPAEDVTSLEGLLFFLRHALVRVEPRLVARNALAAEIRLEFHLESRQTLVKTLALSEPMYEAAPLLKLLKEYLRELMWDAPLEKLDLEISKTIPHAKGQLSLFDKAENRLADMAEYVARLRARFGLEKAGFAELRPSFVPERAWKLGWPPKSETRPLPRLAERPLFLFTPPKPHPVPPRHWRLIPTENLAAEWWEEGAYRRYYIAASPRGERLWLFYDCRRSQWFLHGTFE